jgi:iron complex outermembrane receptor protein
MNPLRLTATIITFLCFREIQAQKQICLSDESTHQVIEGATIYLLEKDEYRLTNASGCATFGNMALSSRIYLECLGYESKIIVDQGAADTMVTLSPSHITMKELMVNGIGTTTRDKSGFRIEKIELTHSNALGQLNLSEAISQLPGVYTANLGNGISKPVIRGMQGMRVVTMLNAMRFEGQQWGGDHGIGIGNAGVGSAEVIKGPASLIYGADAMGGVVIFNDLPPIAVGKKSLEVNTQYQHISRGALTKFTYQQSGQRWRFLIAGGGSSHTDYGIPHKKFAQNSRFQDLQGRGYISYSGKRSVHYIRYAFNSATTGIPGHTHDTLATPADFQTSEPRRTWTLPAQFIRNHIVSQENKWYFANSELHLHTGYSRNNLIEFDEKVSIPSLSMRLDNYLANMKYILRIRGCELTGGAQLMHQINQNLPEAESKLTPNSTSSDAGIYATSAFTLGSIHIQAGVRLDARRIIVPADSIQPLNKNYRGYNYAVGFSYPHKQWTFRTSIASGFRIPHVTELLSDGYHHGALRFEKGNRLLQPEYATQLDCSAEWTSDHTTFMVNPFINRIENFIYIRPTGERLGGMPVFVFTSSEETILAGSEAAIHIHPHFNHNLHFQLTAAIIRVLQADNSSISLLPQPRISGDIRYDFSEISESNIRLKEVGVRATASGEQRQVALGETPSPSYGTLDFYCSIAIGSKQRVLLETGCKNLTNTRYIDHLSRLKNIEMPFPGRNFYLGIHFHIL